MGKITINQDSLKSRQTWNRHKVKEGSNFFRFLPPFGDESNGYPYRRWVVLWGMTDPESGRMRPYASSITSEQKCPVFEYVEQLQKKAEAMKLSLVSASSAEAEDLKMRFKALNKIISAIRPKTVYAWNAVDKAGMVGLIELKPTAHKQLKTAMAKYIQEYSQDPTSVNSADDDSGVWFNVTRTGIGFDTEYKVDKVQMMTRINNQPTYIDDRSALPESVVNNWQTMVYDLSSIYQVKTYDELKTVLLANMPLIIAESPDAYVVGFEPSGAVAQQAPAAIAAPQPVMQQTAQPVTPSRPVVPKVALKLDSADDDDHGYVVAPTRNPAPVAAQKAVSPHDDIFKMADDILNGK